MVDAFLAKIFGTKHEREMKALRPLIAAINELEPRMQQLSDEQLAAKTQEFKQKLANGATLDDILVEAFATVREAGRRVLNMRHYDVQLIGGIVLHRGKIAEMRTGEGKTLVATLAVVPECARRQGRSRGHGQRLSGPPRRRVDGPDLRFLGLTVGIIVHDLDDEERRQSYMSDITYGTNNEFGFDYLRDNMKFRLEDCVQQRGHQLRASSTKSTRS